MDTIASSLFRYAEVQPHALAVVDAGRNLTYAMLQERVRATAGWLYHAGVRTGDTVALPLELTSESSLRSLRLFYALSYLGATVLPLYPDVPISRRVELIGQYKARWLVARGVPGQAADASTIDPTSFDWRDVRWQRAAPALVSDAENAFLIQFTSGTTGTPKVCVFKAGQFAAWSLAAAKALGLTAVDRLVPPRLWPDMVGMRMLVFVHLAGGAFINVLVPNTKRELAAFGRDGMTALWLSPFQLRQVLASEAPHDMDLSRLRALYSGGAFVSPQEIEEVRRTLTRKFYVVYGSNEVGLLAMLGPDDQADAPGVVGKLSSDFEAQAVDDSDQPVPAGGTGLLRFRSKWIPQAYLGNAEATAKHFRHGWFYPGDVGSIDTRGYLKLEGRIDDIINVSGLKISPADVEAVLTQHPDVADAALAGIPDRLSGQVPVAFVVLRRPVPEAELIRFCAERIDAMRAQFNVVPVNQIPRSPDGKILRNKLRDDYLERRRT